MSTPEDRAREHADRCAEARHHHRGGALGAYCEQDFRAGWEAAVEASPPVAPVPPVSLGDLWRKCQAELNNPRATRSQDAIVRELAEEAFAAGVVEAVHMRQVAGSLVDAGELDSITARLRELVVQYDDHHHEGEALTVRDCLYRLGEILRELTAQIDPDKVADEIDDGDLEEEEELPEGAVIVPDRLRPRLIAFCAEQAKRAIDETGGDLVVFRGSSPSGVALLRDLSRDWSRLSLALLGEE